MATESNVVEYLKSIAGMEADPPESPLSNVEGYLAYMAGLSETKPEKPTSRVEELLEIVSDGVASDTSLNDPVVMVIKEETYMDTEVEKASFKNVLDIEDRAFKGASNLKSASFPNAVNIGTDVFAGCDSLTSLSLDSISSSDKATLKKLKGIPLDCQLTLSDVSDKYVTIYPDAAKKTWIYNGVEYENYFYSKTADGSNYIKMYFNMDEKFLNVVSPLYNTDTYVEENPLQLHTLTAYNKQTNGLLLPGNNSPQNYSDYTGVSGVIIRPWGTNNYPDFGMFYGFGVDGLQIVESSIPFFKSRESALNYIQNGVVDENALYIPN